GAIVSGLPFIQCTDEWTALFDAHLGPLLSRRGLSTCVRPDGIWNAGRGAEAIARGCALFARRLGQNLPTYLDTLPSLDVYALTPEGGRWEPLVRQSEVEGGRDYTHAIKTEFALPRGAKDVEVYLRYTDCGRPSMKKAQFHFPKSPQNQVPLN